MRREAPSMFTVREYQERAARNRRQAEQLLRLRLHGRIYRPIFGVKTSDNFGKTWRLAAVCDECRDSVQPPTMRKDLGDTGARSCDWCGARNEKDEPKG